MATVVRIPQDTRCPCSIVFLALSVFLIVCAMMAQPAFANAVRVRFVEGLAHGFVIVRTMEGTKIATGDFLHVVHGQRVVSRMVLSFDDGSVYDDTTEFSQRRVFQLVSDHLVRKGPSFKQALDVFTDARSGQVTVHYKDKDGKDKTDSEHLNLPPDVSNGMIATIVKDLEPNVTETTLPMVVASPRPRLVKLIITNEGDVASVIGNVMRQATSYDVKIKIEGAAGMLAPILGKQPPDLHIAVLGGEAPVTLRLQGALEEDGPIWQVELTSPLWPSGSGTSGKRR